MSTFRMNPRRWTEGAIACYKRGCNCSGCITREILETPCYMKAAVIELVRKLGAPPEEINPKELTKKEQQTIDAILDGCRNYKEIAEKMNVKESHAPHLVHTLYNKARQYYGFVFTTKREKMLPEFIFWVRNGGFEG